jgi:hypothetical protein
MNTKLHAICDSKGRPLNLFFTAGQVIDYIGVRAFLSSFKNFDWCLGIVVMTLTGSEKCLKI